MARSLARSPAALESKAPRNSFFDARSILAPLPHEYVSRLLARAPAKLLAKGQTLFEIGTVGDGCYLLDEGVVKVSIASKLGAERILAILGPGSIVGELAMIDGLPRSATVRALRDSKLTFLARSIFLECLRDHPEIFAQLVPILAARLRQADDEVAASSFLTLKGRVAWALLQFAKHLGEPGTEDQVVIRDRLRQDDLAALADVARENTSRILSEWRKRRIIEQQSNSVYVIHRKALEHEAE